MAAAVPKNLINNLEYTSYFTESEAKLVVEKTGIYQRRFADNKTCSSDLCYAAAEKLIFDNGIDKEEIDLLVFVSQTPDYRMPATSFLLQDRLKLNSDTIVFDVNMGCSGFIHGLYIVYGLMQNKGLRKALLLNGETRSKVYSPKDRTVAYLFGDAGSATLIERDDKFKDSYFSINSLGDKADLVMIPGGGYRNQSSLDTLKEKVVDKNGNIRNDEQAYMKGSDVFQLFLSKVPKDIKEITEYANISSNEIDYFVFHQANNFMNSYLIKKLKIDDLKVPTTISKFGNTSSVSIPLTIVSELKDSLILPKNLLLSGFGVGMTYTSAILKTSNCKISEIVEI